MKFADKLWFDTGTFGWEERKQVFPESYSKIEGNKATPLMGSYVEDLFTVKKERMLKSVMTNK